MEKLLYFNLMKYDICKNFKGNLKKYLYFKNL